MTTDPEIAALINPWEDPPPTTDEVAAPEPDDQLWLFDELAADEVCPF